MESDGPSNSHATLYVGDLHLDCTELMLFNKFSSAGMVKSVRVCRHTVTKQSLGYAYVNFSQRPDAERALATMNFEEMLGNPMRIMWSERNPSLRKSGLGNVFIKNLDKSIDNKAMYDTFSVFGFILSCKVATDEMGVSKGYGFVHFETENAATKAIEKVNGMLLIDQKVFVGKFIPRDMRDKTKIFTNIYIKNIGDDLDDEQLFTIFRPFGQINSHRVMIDDDGKSKGFGFVAFEEPEAAKRACDEYNGQMWNGKVIYVGRAQLKDERKAELQKDFENAKIELIERDQGVNLYIKNLHDSVDDERLRNEFLKYGTITSAKVMTENGRSKGFGFVCYSTPEEAALAVTGMNGNIVASKPLYVSLAQRREDRKAHLDSQYKQHLAGVQMQQMGQMVQPDGTSYFMPTMPQAQRFYPPQMPQIRATHRWPAQPAAQVPAGARATSTFPMQKAPFRTAPHQQQLGPRNVRPMAPRQPPVPNLLQADRPVAPNAGDVPTGALNSACASNFKYNNNPPAVSSGGPAAAAAVALVAQPAIHMQGKEPLTPSMLASAIPQKQKQMLGERLFPLIREINRELPGKITGMLLEMDNSNLLHMLEDGNILRAKVEEAVAVFKAHQPKQQVAAVVAD